MEGGGGGDIHILRNTRAVRMEGEGVIFISLGILEQ